MVYLILVGHSYIDIAIRITSWHLVIAIWILNVRIDDAWIIEYDLTKGDTHYDNLKIFLIKIIHLVVKHFKNSKSWKPFSPHRHFNCKIFMKPWQVDTNFMEWQYKYHLNILSWKYFNQLYFRMMQECFCYLFNILYHTNEKL